MSAELGTSGFLRDESGKLSMSRVLLLGQLVVVNVAGVIEAGTAWEFPGAWWALQAGLMIALVAWAAGPRGLQYLGPQVGKVTGAVAQAVQKAAGRKTPDHDEEDRGWVEVRGSPRG